MGLDQSIQGAGEGWGGAGRGGGDEGGSPPLLPSEPLELKEIESWRTLTLCSQMNERA